MPHVCDGRSAGALLFDGLGRVLLGERAKPPEGIAPPCGHVKDHDASRTHLQAAVDETFEEYGLTVRPEDLVSVYSRWQPNQCGAVVPHPSGGHQWEVLRTDRWSGEVTIAPDEVRSYGWYDLGQVRHLADRTIAYAHGHLSDADWKQAPGLEPVWVDILAITPKQAKPYTVGTDFSDTIVRVPDYRDLEAVQKLYAAKPA